jgi:hypothetical protein
VIEELLGAYPRKVDEIKTIVLAALQHSSGTISDLKKRAQSIKGITGNFQLESFATRIEEYDGSEAAVESGVVIPQLILADTTNNTVANVNAYLNAVIAALDGTNAAEMVAAL